MTRTGFIDSLRGSIGFAACAIVLSGCVQDPDSPPDPDDFPSATWKIDEASPPDPASTAIDVLVTRNECSSGVTGEVNEPTVAESETEVVVTYTVEDLDLDQQVSTCQGNPYVPATFELSEPLGERRLIDGQCAPGREPADTFSCASDVRWEP